MKFFKPLVLLAAAAAFLPACASLNSSADRRLVPPKSYDFLPDKAIVAAEAAGVSNAPYWHRQVEKSIETQLAQKGYVRNSGDSRNLLVAFHVITQHGNKVALLDNYAGYNLSAQERAEQAHIEDFLKAPGAKNRRILIVDVIDPAKREVVWREWVQAPDRTLGRRNAAKQQQAIDRAVSEVLSKFPPKG
jgi:hypothetical protein